MRTLSHARRGFLTAAAAALYGVTGPSWAQGDSYPNRPIRMILPLPPGASVDALARLLGAALGQRLRQTVIIENRPGGNMVIAAQAAAKAEPDGYTLFLTMDLPLVANPSLYTKLPYDAENDFTAISLLATSPMVVTAGPKVQARTMQEFVSYAKTTQSKLGFGAGVVAAQVVGENLKRDAGIDMVYVPFRGGSPTVEALLAGTIELSITDITPVLAWIQSGKVTPLGVTGTRRDPSLPNVPTLVEQGYPAMDLTNWIGLMAPARTPAPIIRRLHEETVAVMARPDIRDKVLALTLEPATSTPGEMAARIRSDRSKWDRIIKAAGVHLD